MLYARNKDCMTVACAGVSTVHLAMREESLYLKGVRTGAGGKYS